MAAENEPAVGADGQEGQQQPGLDQNQCVQQEKGDRAPVLSAAEDTI